jgi:hypothetical protein
MIIGNIRNGIDERQLEEALSKLETMVDQAATPERLIKLLSAQQKGATNNQQVNVYLLRFFSLFNVRINIKVLRCLKAVFAFIGKVFSVVVI